MPLTHDHHLRSPIGVLRIVGVHCHSEPGENRRNAVPPHIGVRRSHVTPRASGRCCEILQPRRYDHRAQQIVGHCLDLSDHSRQLVVDLRRMHAVANADPLP